MKVGQWRPAAESIDLTKALQVSSPRVDNAGGTTDRALSNPVAVSSRSSIPSVNVTQYLSGVINQRNSLSSRGLSQYFA